MYVVHTHLKHLSKETQNLQTKLQPAHTILLAESIDTFFDYTWDGVQLDRLKPHPIILMLLKFTCMSLLSMYGPHLISETSQ